MSATELRITLIGYISFDFIYTGIIALMFFLIFYYVLKMKYKGEGQIISKKTALLVIMQSIYIAILISGTLLNRSVDSEYKMKLMPFWSYQEVWNEANYLLLVQMIFNVLIFIPWPILWGSIFPSMRRFRWGVGSALLFSIFIEVTQLVFKLGLFEFDDMFHNVLGAVIGYYIWKLCRKFKQKGIEE